MNITLKSIKDIRPYGKNPRRNDKSVDAVANSIREFGFQSPIIIDGDGVIVCGHARYKAAKKLGLTEVPTLCADDLTEEQVKAYRLADNKTAELSKWDLDKLYEEVPGIEMDLDQFGFDFASLDEPQEPATRKVSENEEIDLSDFDDDTFENVCPCCGFRFND